MDDLLCRVRAIFEEHDSFENRENIDGHCLDLQEMDAFDKSFTESIETGLPCTYNDFDVESTLAHLDADSIPDFRKSWPRLSVHVLEAHLRKGQFEEFVGKPGTSRF